MRIGEVFLRLGCTLVGWLVVYAYGVWLAVVPRIACAASGSDPLAVSLGFALLAGAFVPLLPAAYRVPGMADTLRWLAVPLVAIVPGGLVVVAPFLWQQTVLALPLCEAPVGAAALERAWAPLQLAVLAGLSWAGWRSVRAGES